jgi:hypothetical protein
MTSDHQTPSPAKRLVTAAPSARRNTDGAAFDVVGEMMAQARALQKELAAELLEARHTIDALRRELAACRRTADTKIDPDQHDSPCGTGRGRGPSQGAQGAAPPLIQNGCGND